MVPPAAGRRRGWGVLASVFRQRRAPLGGAGASCARAGGGRGSRTRASVRAIISRAHLVAVPSPVLIESRGAEMPAPSPPRARAPRGKHPSHPSQSLASSPAQDPWKQTPRCPMGGKTPRGAEGAARERRNDAEARRRRRDARTPGRRAASTRADARRCGRAFRRALGARLAIVTMGRRAPRMGCGWVSFMYHRPDDPGGPPDEARVKGEPNARGGGRASLAPLSLFRLAEDLAP